MAPLPDYHISFETLLSFVIVFYFEDEVQTRSGKGCSLNWRYIYKVNLFMRKCSGLLFRRGQVSHQFPQHSYSEVHAVQYILLINYNSQRLFSGKTIYQNSNPHALSS